MIGNIDFNKFKNIIILIFLSSLFLIFVIARITFPDLDHGDEFADACTLGAGKNFVKFGFLRCRFLPMYGQQIDAPKDPYTHYPPLPEIINGLIRMISKSDSLWIYRAISLFFSFLNLIFWYLFIKKISNSYFIAFLASIFYFTNPFFIFGADSIRELSLSDFVRSLILFIFISVLDFPKEKQKKLLIFLWFLIFLESLITFDYIIYLLIFFILFKYLFKNKENYPSFRIILILSSASVIGFLLHFIQNAWYFGSISLAIEDFKNIAIDRVFKSKDAPLAEFNFLIWWNYVIVRYFSLIFSFNYFILGIGVFVSYTIYQPLAKKIKKNIKILLKLLVVFGISGISWYIFFPAHSFAHTFVPFLVRHIVPFASVTFVVFFYILWEYIKEKTKYQIYWRIFWFILVIIVLFTSINNSELPITPSNIKRAKDFLIFKECLLRLRAESNEKDIIFTNHFRFPFMRYYTDRNVSFAYDKSFFDSKKPIPKYFIFLLRNDPYNKDFYEFLIQKYEIMFKCNSLRFPSVFLRLKNES